MRRVRVDVGGGPVLDAKDVDLERGDFLQRFLPAPFVHGDRALHLLAQLREVDVESGPFEKDVSDEVPREQRAPVHARRQAVDVEDGRLRVRLLPHDEPVERHRKAEEPEAELRDTDVVAFEPVVHPALDAAAQRLVHEERAQDHDDA